MVVYTEIPDWANTDEDVVGVAQQPAPRLQPDAVDVVQR